MTRIFCLFLLLFAPLNAETLAIVKGRVLDGTGSEARVRTVYVRDGRFAESASVVDRTIDATGMTVLPGLFDLHTHLAASGSVAGADWGKNLKSYLVSGVTDVIDMSTYPAAYEPMRRMMAFFPAPHDFIAARITTPGGHGAEAGRGDIFSLEVLTPREGRAAVQRVLPQKPDVIKVFTDGWRYDTAPDMTSMDEATLAAIVDEAHKAHLKVLTHTVTLGRAKMAARAGVDVLAHGTGDLPVDAEMIALMKQHGTAYTSTLAVFEPRKNAPPERMKRWRNLLGNLKSLRDAGVLLVCGTDAGEPGTPHGSSTLHELELMVQAGLTPAEALTAATGNSARALGVEADRGTVAPGFRADLILVQGEPDHDIAAIRQTRRVFLEGREIDREKLMREVALPGVTPLPAIPAAKVIDDFEHPAARINNTDAGHDHSRIMYSVVNRSASNHSLEVLTRMSEKEKPFARVLFPLSPGGFQPVDASRFHGIRAQVRGEGAYSVVVIGRTETWTAAFEAGTKWRTVAIPFGAHTAKDLQSVGFEIARPAGETTALDVDRVEFY